MFRLINLQPYFGNKKTLVISTDQIEQYYTKDSQIFVHIVENSKLLHYDNEQKEALKYYIEDKKCAQVIVAGSKDERLISTIRRDESLYSLGTALRFNLAALLKDKHDKIISQTIQMQMFGEFLVAKQCKLLMDYFFVKERVQQNKLKVQGVIPSLDGHQLKSIFYNGIVYNDLLTLN